jgi:hypothetical protein
MQYTNTNRIKALCVARFDKRTYPNIFKSCRGLILMGTPHSGTGDFTSEKLALKIINANVPVELSAVDVLKTKNETRIDLVEDFTKLINDPKVRDRLQIFCFFEQISTTVSDMLKKAKNNTQLDMSTMRVSVQLMYTAKYLTKHRNLS